MARTDDIINVAGHRLSTGAMEEVGNLDINTIRNCFELVDDTKDKPSRRVLHSSLLLLHELCHAI